jgi:acylphosphatase
MKCFHIYVSGKVQGVFFRDNTVEVAKKLGITGWVRNLNDGRVEIVAEGSKEKLEEFIEWLKKGPIFSKVVDLTIEEETFSGAFSSFQKKITI